jgi:hypothetical protein
MSINVQEFFRRLVDKLGLAEDPKIEKVFVQFNGDTVIQLLKFLGNEQFEYRFIPVHGDRVNKWYSNGSSTRRYRVASIRRKKETPGVLGGRGSLHINLEDG